MHLDLQGIGDTVAWALTTGGTILGALGAIWLAVRKRIGRWWEPYRKGLEGAAQVPVLTDRIDALDHNVSTLSLSIRAQGDTDIERGLFEADSTGANTYVNLTYARWLGVGRNELLGWDWVNFVHPEDRIRVRTEWDACRREHRKYGVRFRFVDSDGETLTVDALAFPIPDSPPARQWNGVLRRVVD